MRIVLSLFRNEWRFIQAHPGQWLQPILFCTLILILLTLGNDPGVALRASWGPSAIWVASLLSLLSTLDSRFHTEFEEGTLEPWLFSPYPLGLLLGLKTFVLWVFYALPFVLLSPVWSLLLGVPLVYWAPLALSLACGTLAIQFINLLGASLTIGLRRGGLFLPLLLLPLYVPVVIFATTGIQMVGIDDRIWASFALLGACALGAVTLAPPIAARALRISFW